MRQTYHHVHLPYTPNPRAPEMGYLLRGSAASGTAAHAACRSCGSRLARARSWRRSAGALRWRWGTGGGAMASPVGDGTFTTQNFLHEPFRQNFFTVQKSLHPTKVSPSLSG